MQFQAQPADTGRLRLRDQALPIGDHHLVPLPGQHARRLRRPGRGDPVGIGIARAAGTARHHHHALHAQQPGEPDRLRGDRLMLPPDFAGMQRIAGAVQRAQRQTMIAQLRHELAARGSLSSIASSMQMRCARPVAARKLQHLDAKFGRRMQQLVQRQMAQAVGNHADAHRVSYLRVRINESLTTRPVSADSVAASASSSAFSPSSPSGFGGLRDCHGRDERVQLRPIGRRIALQKERQHRIGHEARAVRQLDRRRRDVAGAQQALRAMRLDALVIAIGGATRIGDLAQLAARRCATSPRPYRHLRRRRSTGRPGTMPAACTSTGSSPSRKRAMSRSWIVMSRNSPPDVAT